MTICGVAPGSSQGRAPAGFDWLTIMRPTLSEIPRRRRAPACRRVKGPLDHACCDHAAFPCQLAVEIDIRPQRRADGTVRRFHDCESDVAFTGRRPGR